MPSAPLIFGPGLARTRLRVQDSDVVWLRAVLEAYDGLASLHGDGNGFVTLTTTEALAGELDALVDELAAEAPVERLVDELP